MKITKEQVKHVATLCKLDLSDSELEKFADLFTETLSHMHTLEELDTSSVRETYQVTGLVNVFGSENRATLPKDAALQNASKTIRDLFVTGAVLNK